MTSGLTDLQLRTSPAPEEWSASAILAHLRSCADVWGGSIQAILRQERPVIRTVNPRQWIKRTDYPDLDFRPSLVAFTSQRRELLEILEDLHDSQWSLTATVTGAGPPAQRTVLAYAQRLAQHERVHLGQIARIVKGVGA
jgi:hypothetical protein